MIKKFLLKLTKSIIKIILPILSKIFTILRVNRRVINYLNDKSINLNNYYEFSNIINQLLKNKKLQALDVGAQGGFNSEIFFPKKYNNFFEPVMIEPIKVEAEKLKKNYKLVIDKGLWSSKMKKKIFILGNRLGSSSMYEPDESSFSMYNLDKKNIDSFKVTDTHEIDCEQMSEALVKINVNELDYLKIDTQGAELDILKGMSSFRPLLIRLEVQIFSIYKGVPNWTKLVSFLDDLGYMVCECRNIGSHKARLANEMDMVFIPNFRNKLGRSLIKKNENKFISLMLIFGQLELLKQICNDLHLNLPKEVSAFKDRFFF
jgi:FkbM family methyltransferase